MLTSLSTIIPVLSSYRTTVDLVELALVFSPTRIADDMHHQKAEHFQQHANASSSGRALFTSLAPLSVNLWYYIRKQLMPVN